MFHEEDGRINGEGRNTIHHTHRLILVRSKYFLLFSIDNVEKDGFALQKEENWDFENIRYHYILSIGEIYTLDYACAANLARASFIIEVRMGIVAKRVF